MSQNGSEFFNNRINLEKLNIKVNIGTIVFDILLDQNFFTNSKLSTSIRHDHSVYEIHFITDGSGSVCLDNNYFDVVPNSFFIVAPNIFHEHIGDPVNPISEICFMFEYAVNSKLAAVSPREENSQLINILENLKYFYSIDIYNNLPLINEIQNEMKLHLVGYYAKIQSMFTQIIINILRSVTMECECSYGIPQKLLYERRNAVIEDFFYFNYGNNPSVNDLSVMLHISSKQLNRILKEFFSKNFKEKLLETRIEISKGYLKDTLMPIKDICEKIGYDSVSNFSYVFKQKTGYTPALFRKMNHISKVK